MKGSFIVTLSPDSNFAVVHNVSSMYCWSSSGKYVNLQVIRSIHKCYIYRYRSTCQVSRLCCESHNFTAYLMLSPLLATDFSRFLEKIFWSCKFGFQARYRQIASSIQNQPAEEALYEPSKLNAAFCAKHTMSMNHETSGEEK